MDNTLLFSLYNRYKQRFAPIADSLDRDQVSDQWRFTIHIPADGNTYTAVHTSKNDAKAYTILQMFEKRHPPLYNAIVCSLDELSVVEDLFNKL